jgi:predicted pyridoxine 5'-phosphate oxidase superfamily flavin-nucleotide-binding protein
MKKTIAAVAALTMLFAVVGCGAQEDSSETVAETTVAETTATESAEETEATTEAATVGEVELSEDPVTFEDITFQTPMMWSTANVEGLSVWYPMDGSGALTLQIFDPSTMGLEDETQEEILESLGKNLAMAIRSFQRCGTPYRIPMHMPSRTHRLRKTKWMSQKR